MDFDFFFFLLKKIFIKRFFLPPTILPKTQNRSKMPSKNTEFSILVVKTLKKYVSNSFVAFIRPSVR